MFTDNSDQIAAALANWLQKPFVSWWFAFDVIVALGAVIAVVVTQIWWLLFIPLLAFMECSALYFGWIFADVLRKKEAEIDRLRSQSGTV
jgi:hypothetical protein